MLNSHKSSPTVRTLFLLLFAFSILGCENPIKKAVRETQYSAYEFVGVQKRDLLKKRINETKEEQKEAGESFESALDRLQKLYGLDGGKLEKEYRNLQSSFEDSQEKAKKVVESRERMQTVASDLFKEWEAEIKEIKTAEFKSKSRNKLVETKNSFDQLNKNLAQSEKKMQPVLDRLRDHVLYLKHNLNAQSITSLKSEHGRIEKQIGDLIADMNKSIAHADAFIKTIE